MNGPLEGTVGTAPYHQSGSVGDDLLVLTPRGIRLWTLRVEAVEAARYRVARTTAPGRRVFEANVVY